MGRITHEIRDPLHVFIRLSHDERRILDSRPFQRLRHIHQLALTSLVYPGATHRRFEHSLGVMELAGRVFEVVTEPENLPQSIPDAIRNEFVDEHRRTYWHRAIRMAALCHDMGHLPFSHAAEEQLLPDDWDHERITAEIIQSEEMVSLWKTMKLDHDDITKLAIGPKKAAELGYELGTAETILSEIIVGDAFGVDRIDYLLRDSHHTSVAYGRFDHHRLIDCLRVLPAPPPEQSADPVATSDSCASEFALGIDDGGLQSAEAMMLARYFMYSQVYFHPVRRIYDIHLCDYLSAWLEGGEFPIELERHLVLTDNEVTSAMLAAAHDVDAKGHDHAKRIVDRNHYRVLYERNPADVKRNLESGQTVFHRACERFDSQLVRHDRYPQKGTAPDFPVQMRDGTVVSSLSRSIVLQNIPVISVDYVFVDESILSEAKDWLREEHDNIILPEVESE